MASLPSSGNPDNDAPAPAASWDAPTGAACIREDDLSPCYRCQQQSSEALHPRGSTGPRCRPLPIPLRRKPSTTRTGSAHRSDTAPDSAGPHSAPRRSPMGAILEENAYSEKHDCEIPAAGDLPPHRPRGSPQKRLQLCLLTFGFLPSEELQRCCPVRTFSTAARTVIIPIKASELKHRMHHVFSTWPST